MYYHIHYLKIIITTCLICFPSAFIFFGSAVQMRKCTIARKNAIMTWVVYLILISIVYIMGYLNNINISLSIWIVIGVGCGILVIFLELAMAQYKIKRKFGYYTKIIRPPASYIESFSFLNAILIIFAAALEEILFRQIIILELYGLFDMLLVGVILSCLLYAVNHIYFSVFSVAQKIVSGFIFSILFIFSGYNILVPIITHCVQNLVLYLFGTYTYGKESKK